MSLAVLADHMASKGRGPDSMLIHMSPREVQGLQALAVKNGGSLTINPDTGLPEAGFLDKLLPTIIGAGLTFFSGGAINPMMAAGIVGGIQTVRTGDIGKGLAAGLGAYGGAGLTAGLTEAGASTIGANEAAKGLAMTPELAAELQIAGEGAKDTLLQQQVADRVATATPYEKLSAGFDTFKANPTGMTKSLASPLMMAAGPAIMAGANVQAKGPQTVTKPGMIRPYAFDPYGGTYTAGTPYEAAPTRSAEGGLMGLAAGGMAGYGDGDDIPRRSGMAQGGMYDFAQRSEPVVRMASGGIAGYAVGGAPKMLSDEELYQQTGSWEAAAAARDAQNNALNQYNWSQQANAAPVAAAVPEHGFGESVHSIVTGQDYPNTGGGLAALNTAAPTYNQYTDQQIASYLATNPNVDIQSAIKTTNADPAAVNRYLASLDDPFRGSTDTTGGSGTLGIYNQMKAQGIDPNELYAASTAFDPKYAGWSAADIAKGYQLDKGAYALSDKLKGVVSDKDWAKFMDDNNYSVNDMAQAFGLSRNEVKARYDAAKKEEKKTTVTGTGGGGTGLATAGPETTTTLPTNWQTNAPAGTSNPYGNKNNPGDLTFNPDGTVTVTPNIPGRPYGGFSGIDEVTNAYTAGGGRTGYIPYAPKTIEEFNAKYNKLTGGSKQSYDYLMGKTPYDPVPSTPTGELMKPYWESVGRFPTNLATKKYIFKDGKYVLNPDYVKPPYVLAAEKAAAGKETVKADAASGKSINVIDNQGNTEQAYMRDDGFYYTSSGNKFDEKGIQVAAGGGLMAMARGGTAQYNLGDYSDGGRLLRGPGDGVSDSIPATIGNKRPARLADGEFVVPARIVSELGNGSTEAGARKLYAMMDRIQKARRGTVGKGRVAKNSRSEKYLPA